MTTERTRQCAVVDKHDEAAPTLSKLTPAQHAAANELVLAIKSEIASADNAPEPMRGELLAELLSRIVRDSYREGTERRDAAGVGR